MKLYGKTAAPYGWTVFPDGTVTEPYGATLKPYGKTAVPYGLAVFPDGTVAAPYGASLSYNPSPATHGTAGQPSRETPSG